MVQQMCMMSDEDRLSTLPNEILLEILSLLRLEHAAVTNALSRRWRGLWTKINSLNIYSPDFMRYEDKFCTNTNKLLMQLMTSPSIHKIRLDLSKTCKKPSLIKSLAHLIRVGKVREVYLNRLTLCIDLAVVIFQNQSLVALELRDVICHPLSEDMARIEADDYAINLPNLKKLRMRLSLCRSWPLIAKRISSCPSLEEIILEDVICSGKLDITSPNLKRLEIYHNISYSRDTEIVISAPKLEYFIVSDGNPLGLKFHFDKYPTSLLKAKLTMAWVCSKADISQARSIILDTPQLVPPKVFHNLTHLVLRLSMHNNFIELPRWLECCPILEDLVLNCENLVAGESILLSSKNSPPACLLTRIKSIQIRIHRLMPCNQLSYLNMVHYLLVNGHVLERFVIKVTGNDQILDTELQFYRKVNEFPRSSLQCKTEFSGKFMST